MARVSEEKKGAGGVKGKDDAFRSGCAEVGPYDRPGMGQGQIPGSSGEGLRMPVGTGLMDMGAEGNQVSRVDASKKRLAKRANQIYRSLCDELELKECFFHGFRAWSAFVDGKISENRFYEEAKAEAQDLISKRGD